MNHNVKPLYQHLASAIQARLNCQQANNAEWFPKWTARIKQLADLLPSGSGINSGTKIDLDASHASKIVLYTAFHHMNDTGYYDGWTEHTLVVTPAFDGINIRISGRNRNDIKDYLHEVYHYALTRMVEETAEGYKLVQD